MGWAGERKTTYIDKNPTSAPQRSRGSSASIHGRVKCAQALSKEHCCQYRSISTNLVHPVSFEPEEGRAQVPQRTTLGFGSEKWAVFKIHLHGNSKQTPRETCMAEAEGAPCSVLLYNYCLAVGALPWATSTACSPLAVSAGGGFWLGSTPPCLVTGQIKPPTSLGVICDKI